MVRYFGYLQNDIQLKKVFGNNDKIYNYIPLPVNEFLRLSFIRSSHA